MSKLTRAWVDSQIEQEFERGCHAEAVRDLAALIIVRDFMTEGDEDMRKDGRRYNPEKQHEKHQPKDRHLTREEAEAWVHRMASDDGIHGGRWTYDEAVSVAAKSGIAPAEYADFYAAINAVASDYGMAAKRHGVDRLDYWVDMAKAFMHDDDAVDGKIYEYRQYIAK